MSVESLSVFFNGQKESLSQRISLQDFLKAKACDNPFYAVAINCEFIPKGDYSTKWIEDGDEIEVVAPMQGG